MPSFGPIAVSKSERLTIAGGVSKLLTFDSSANRRDTSFVELLK